MQNNSLAQIKLRANEFIEDYERQVTERQYQKQKLKQNIMLQIMSNRHRSQASQSNPHDQDKSDSVFGQSKILKQPVSDDRALSLIKNNKSNVNGFNRSNSVPNALNENQDEQMEPKLQSAQITFKMSKNRNNFTNQDPKPQDKKELIKDQSLAEQHSRYYDDNETLRQPKIKSSKSIESNEAEKNRSNLRVKKQADQIEDKYSNYRNKKPSSEDSDTQRREVVQEQIELPQKNNKPIFLTLDEDQSVEISQDKKNKNLAFDIVMEKSEPIDDIDELRRRKIEEMEKKRHQRLEQFRKQQELKKMNNEQKDKDVKRSNSYLKNNNKSNQVREEEVNQIDLPKSRSRRKINDREEKINVSSQNIVQQSHYNMKPPQPQRSSYIAPDREKSDNDYLQTPKSIISDYRVDKSKGKNTIFRESPKRVDKSASKYSQDPKIEPKERKNTFVKQSNKKLMITALSNACLPGELNRKQRERLTQIIQKQPSQFLVFLFKEYSRKVIKAIYTLDSSQTYLIKIYGEKAPQEIVAENVQSFYRFDSGSRQFKKLDGCKSFSLVVHAIDLA